MSHFVDIHCHLLPSIDDGAKDEADSLAMARMAIEHGVDSIIVTPHQLGNFAFNQGDAIRQRTKTLQALLRQEGIPLALLPGADVRIEDGMIDQLLSGEVLSLGDHRKHVLLELPHELYFPLEPVLDALTQQGMVGILSHPERNQGILQQPRLIESLVDYGCLMQVTTGSFVGGFGPASQQLAEKMAQRGMVHFLSTDGHGAKSRRPRMQDGFEAASRLAGEEAATKWCGHFPRAVFEGREVPSGRVATTKPKQAGWSFWKRRSA